MRKTQFLPQPKTILKVSMYSKKSMILSVKVRIQGCGVRGPKAASVLYDSAPGLAQHPAGTLNILITPPPPPSEFLSGCRPVGQSLPGGPSLSAPGRATSRSRPGEPPKVSCDAAVRLPPHPALTPTPAALDAGQRGAGHRDQEGSTNGRTSRPHPSRVADPEGGSQTPTPPHRRARSPRSARAHLAWSPNPTPPGPGPIGRAPPPGRWGRRGLGAGRQLPPPARAHWLGPRGSPKTGVQFDWAQRLVTAAPIGCGGPRDAGWRLAPGSEGLLLVRFQVGEFRAAGGWRCCLGQRRGGGEVEGRQAENGGNSPCPQGGAWDSALAAAAAPKALPPPSATPHSRPRLQGLPPVLHPLRSITGWGSGPAVDRPGEAGPSHQPGTGG